MKKFLCACLFILCNHLFSQNDAQIVVLGTLQDGGLPHIKCTRSCCIGNKKINNYKVSSLGLTDPSKKKFYIFDATPDFSTQFNYMKNRFNYNLDGIFLTHAHIGHYSGLMFLGKEAMNSVSVPVFTMPRMFNFLNENQPWFQLINESNIITSKIYDNKLYKISDDIHIKPVLVPHRDEFSETVGFYIYGPNKKILFIPDIDKWSKWKLSLKKIIRDLDLLFIDGTFYDNSEINYRDINEIPHPFIKETLEYLENIPVSDKNKIYFIHLNHTNPLIDPTNHSTLDVISKGYNIAKFGQTFGL